MNHSSSENSEKILLFEEVETLPDCKKIPQRLNNFSDDAVKNLNIPPYEDPSVNTDHIEDPIKKSTEKLKNHQSIKLIKGFLNNSTFSFDESTISDIEKELKNFYS